MNTAMLATTHITGAGIAGIIVGLAIAAGMMLFLVVDPNRHH